MAVMLSSAFLLHATPRRALRLRCWGSLRVLRGSASSYSTGKPDKLELFDNLLETLNVRNENEENENQKKKKTTPTKKKNEERFELQEVPAAHETDGHVLQKTVERREDKKNSKLLEPILGGIRGSSPIIDDIRIPVQPENPRFVKVAILGHPNAGKSTLVNRLVGRKVTIVSPTVHTTRERFLGIRTIDNTQIALIDTPGILSHSDGRRLRLPRSLMVEPRLAAAEADIALCLINTRNLQRSKADFSAAELFPLFDDLEVKSSNRVLVFNKIDMVEESSAIFSKVEEVARREGIVFDATFKISALRGTGVASLLAYLVSLARSAAWEYPDDIPTPVSKLKLVEELIREQIFELYSQEIPYLITQANIRWEEHVEGVLHLHQILFVAKPSQVRLVVGKQGCNVTKMTRAVEESLKAMFQKRVVLEISVQVK